MENQEVKIKLIHPITSKEVTYIYNIEEARKYDEWMKKLEAKFNPFNR